MPQTALARPDAGEFAPYYGKYVALVPDGDVTDTLERQIGETLDLLRGVSEQKAEHRYAPGKWSVKEVVGHLTDAERVFAYRALRFARGDRTPLPGFDENTWVAGADFARRPLADLAEELETTRAATVCLLRGLDPAAFDRRGLANDVEVSVRALAWIIAGHERHHVAILKERYL